MIGDREQGTGQRKEGNSRGEGSFPAFPSQTWYLTADITCWPGLMPHVHGVEILDTYANRTLARIDARYGWIPVAFDCGFEHDEEHMMMHRWYRGTPWNGIVEAWRVREVGDRLVELSYAIYARGWRQRLLARIVIAPMARRQFEMIDLLAVAHRRAQESDGW